MSSKDLLKVIKVAGEVTMSVLAAVSFIVLVSDVADSLRLWEVIILKGVAFAVLSGAFLLSPWCQDNVREIMRGDC